MKTKFLYELEMKFIKILFEIDLREFFFQSFRKNKTYI